MYPQPAGGFCDIRQTEGKGLGLFAKIDIAKGTVISDEITISIDTGNYDFSAATWENPEFWENLRTHRATNVEKAMSDLISYYKNDGFQQSVLDRLSRSLSAEGLSDLANLLFTNCHPASNSHPLVISFGPTTCAFNHSCVANATFRGHSPDGPEDDPLIRLTQVVAVKPIKAGTEITVPYLPSSLPTAERRAQLHAAYRFKCVCDICMDETTETRNSYAQIKRLSQIIEAPLDDDESKQRTPWLFFEAARDMAEEYKKHGIQDWRYAQLLEHCASVSAYHSDAIRTYYFVTLAELHWSILRPSEAARKQPIKLNPELHPYWGHTTLGLSLLEDYQLFRSRTMREDVTKRIMMDGHEGSYDRIMPREEAFAEEERLAQKAAEELIAEEDLEKEKTVVTPAKKVKKKKTRKNKRKNKSTDKEEDEKKTEEEKEENKENEEKKENEQNEKNESKDKVKEKRKEKEENKEAELVVAAAAAVEDREQSEGRGSAGFSVGDAAVAGELGKLGRMRAFSQPPPFSPAPRYDETLVLPRVGREYSRLCASYLDVLGGSLVLSRQ